MTSRPKVEKWKEWADGRVKNEILAMHLRRVPWRAVNEMAKKNELPQSYWWEYFSDTYAVTQSIVIRRQLDQGTDAVSLGRLLYEVAADPGQITRKFWVGLWERDDDGDNGYWKKEAERQWRDNFAGSDPELLNPDIPTADFAALQEGGKKMKDYVDRHVAHVDRRGLPPDRMPSYDDIDAVIDLIGATFNKYFPLFTAATMYQLTPEIQDDWQAVFRVPWMPRDDD